MDTPEISDEIVELATRARKPHLWNGKPSNALAKSVSLKNSSPFADLYTTEDVQGMFDALASPGNTHADDRRSQRDAEQRFTEIKA